MRDLYDYWRETPSGVKHNASAAQICALSRIIKLDEDEIGEIDGLVLGIIARSIKNNDSVISELMTDRGEILDYLNRTNYFSTDVLNNLDLFVGLELRLVAVMNRLGVLDGIAGMQFPVDIRVVHPVPPEGYLDQKDAADYLHCDPWRGEPPDLINCLLYIEVGDDTSQLKLYDSSLEQMKTFKDYIGPEKEAPPLVAGISEVIFKHENGQFIQFDAYAPHHVRRNGDKVRISLNFSLRRMDPYDVLDESWDRPRQAWHRFWCVNSGKSTTLEARIQDEIAHLKREKRNEAVKWRQQAIEKYFVNKVEQELY